MKKPAICQNCQYDRPDHLIAMDIPGSGNWCSNSESPKHRSRVADNDSCSKFIQRGRKAPIKMRIAVKAMGTANKALSKLSVKRHRKRK